MYSMYQCSVLPTGVSHCVRYSVIIAKLEFVKIERLTYTYH